MSEDNDKTVKETRSKEVRAAIAGCDTLLWQGECNKLKPIGYTKLELIIFLFNKGLASVAIPGAVINCKYYGVTIQ